MASESDSLDELDIIDAQGATEDGMYEHFRFVADKGQALLRVDKFLVDRLVKSSRNRAATGRRSRMHPRERTSGKEQLPRKAARCRDCSNGPTQV